MSGARRGALYVAAAAVVWYACIVIFWAVHPLTDTVPVGVDYSLKQPAFVSVSVDCNGLFDSTARDASPLPALKPQPKGSPALAYQRQACGLVQHQGRIVLAADTVLVVALVVFCGWFAFRRGRSRSDDPVEPEASLFGMRTS